jgi:hypothetical protein
LSATSFGHKGTFCDLKNIIRSVHVWYTVALFQKCLNDSWYHWWFIYYLIKIMLSSFITLAYEWYAYFSLGACQISANQPMNVTGWPLPK